VIRPGGFTVDPAQELTVLQAVSLAWGPSQNAALQKALLIREQKGGRIVTTLNLRRMLRGRIRICRFVNGISCLCLIQQLRT